MQAKSNIEKLDKSFTSAIFSARILVYNRLTFNHFAVLKESHLFKG